MRDFKFLSIRALEDCAPALLKNLIPGQLYSFYQFFGEKENAQARTFEDDFPAYQVPEDLYQVSLKNGEMLSINISAIVGKNGTGKSSIIELFLASLCVLALRTGTHDEDIPKLRGVLNELDNRTDIDSVKKRDNAQAKLDNLTKMMADLKSEISFSINGTVHLLEINPSFDNGFQLRIPVVKLADDSFTDPIFIDDKSVLDHFFYTMMVNYSHYALNSRHIGLWIDKLFQKNDGYRLPVVITPMRDEGNFNINTEMYLAKSRLLTNIMINRSHDPENSTYPINDAQHIGKITFKLNYDKLEKYFNLEEHKVSGNQRKTNMILDLFQIIFPEDDTAIFGSNSFLIDLASNYIVNKIEKIKEKYQDITGDYVSNEEMIEAENLKFLRSILEEESHISYKIRRAAYFIRKLKNDGADDKFEEADYSDTRYLPVYEMSIDELYKWMGTPRREEVPQKLPPSFFDVDFIVSSKDSQPNSFDSMSSGEMHLVHTIQSVIYHINNIQSAHLSTFPRLKYRFANIILDEIELYFHPDLQRRFIEELRYSLSKIPSVRDNGVQAINILLLTHSPFILSDIPVQNVLLLKKDAVTNKSVPVAATYQTFAGNVNEILSDSFFLEGSLMGKFAEEKIESLVNQGEGKVDRDKILSLIGDTFLKAHIEEFLNG